MKISPISTDERTLIMQHLADSGNWETCRGAAHIRFELSISPVGHRIRYAVGFGSLNIAGSSTSAGAAVDQVNAILLENTARGRRLAALFHCAAPAVEPELLTCEDA